jgi:hypothetical protein
MTARRVREARVLRARRQTTEARQSAERFAARGADDLARIRNAEADRAAEAERTAAEAPQNTRVPGFGPRAGRGEFRRG